MLEVRKSHAVSRRQVDKAKFSSKSQNKEKKNVHQSCQQERHLTLSVKRHIQIHSVPVLPALVCSWSMYKPQNALCARVFREPVVIGRGNLRT